MRTQLLIHPEELSRKWIDRMAALGVECLALHPVGGPAAAKSLDRMLEALTYPEYRALLDYAREKGLKIEYEFHAAGWLMPRKLFAEHPDWFRMNEKGERTDDMNFCITNEEALAYYAERAALLASKLYASEPNYYFWLDDVRGMTCHCEKCSKLTASEQQMTVVNAVAKRLKQDNPSAKVAYLAYQDFIAPPVKVQPEDNVFVEYAPFDRDMNASVRLMPQWEQDNLKDLLACFGAKDSKVLEYWLDNSFYSDWVRPTRRLTPDNARIRDDMQFYLDLGYERISSFACFLGADYEELYGEPDIASFAQGGEDA